ncbi:PHD and RING finger domain-containing protein 1, variant 2 [Trebouxia sp. C0009 RCD-2024]
MSRPPVACAVEEATIMVLAVETAAAAGDSDEDRITYATDDPEYREGGSDSGPSVLEELCCEFPKEHGCAMTVTKPQKPQPMSKWLSLPMLKA